MKFPGEGNLHLSAGPTQAEFPPVSEQISSFRQTLQEATNLCCMLSCMKNYKTLKTRLTEAQ